MTFAFVDLLRNGKALLVGCYRGTVGPWERNLRAGRPAVARGSSASPAVAPPFSRMDGC